MQRTELLREDILDAAPAICPERATLFTESYRESEGQPVILRKARAFARVLEGMSIYISSGELVVGNQAGQPRAAPVFPEYSAEWVLREMDDFSTRPLDRFEVGDEAKAQLREIVPYWRGKTHYDRVTALAAATWPREMQADLDLPTLTVNQVFGVKHTSGEGHATPNYEMMLEIGLEGVREEACARNRALDMAQPESPARRLFYQAVIISSQAAMDFARRFSGRAREMAEAEEDLERRGELEEIARICERVPARPARSLWEAVQSVWFLHLLVQIESNGHSIPLGRIDQYLYPYYCRDLETGAITRERALALAECLFVKCSEVNKVRSRVDSQHLSGYPMFQTVTLGGQTTGGADATTDLTYLFLEASGNVKLPQPTVAMRVHGGTPEGLMLAAARSLIAHGGGIPGFFNDDVAIAALMSKGVSLADARNWSVMGCSEPQVMGKFLPSNGGFAHFNLLKILEVALNNGTNPDTALQPCPGRGDLSTFQSFDEVWQAFQQQIDFYTRLAPLLSNIACTTLAELNPCPFLSSLLSPRPSGGDRQGRGRGRRTQSPDHGQPWAWRGQHRQQPGGDQEAGIRRQEGNVRRAEGGPGHQLRRPARGRDTAAVAKPGPEVRQRRRQRGPVDQEGAR